MKARTFILTILAGYSMACFSHSADSITVAMTGDIMMGTTYPGISLPPKNGEEIFRDVKPFLQQATITVGNLEGTLLDGGKSTKSGGPNSYAFRTPTSFSHLLKDAGYDFLSMANNHANDFGAEGIASTEKQLNLQGIKYAGIKGHVESAVVIRNGIKFGLCAFGHNQYTLKHRDLQTVKRILDDLKKKSDVIIVSFHGGAEGRSKNHLPQGAESFLGEDRGSLREFAHFCIDNGADIVYGHGPHVVRATEVYKGRFIAYSLGNFCTPYGMSLAGISAYSPVVVIRIDKQGRFLSGKIHSFLQQKGIGPRKDSKQSVAHEIMNLTKTDVPHSEATIDSNGNIKLK
jgi:hypothetical protein